VTDQIEFWSVLAEDTDRPFRVDIADGPVLVRASAADLAAGVDALLGNVFAHTPDGTPFVVVLEQRRTTCAWWWRTGEVASRAPIRSGAAPATPRRLGWAWTSPDGSQSHPEVG
jgi:hypothetical protein